MNFHCVVDIQGCVVGYALTECGKVIAYDTKEDTHQQLDGVYGFKLRKINGVRLMVPNDGFGYSIPQSKIERILKASEDSENRRLRSAEHKSAREQANMLINTVLGPHEGFTVRWRYSGAFDEN